MDFLSYEIYLYPASHAHTLLLDLEQLVVVANLDKIKLDSSSTCLVASPHQQKSSTTLHNVPNNKHSSADVATKSKMSSKNQCQNGRNAMMFAPPKNTFASERNNPTANHTIINQRKFNKTLVTENAYQMGLLDQYLIFSKSK